MSEEWRTLATDPALRVRAATSYASYVIGDKVRATRWLEECHASIRDGSCSVVKACESPDGFLEAMLELVRLSALNPDERKLYLSRGT
jgi:hypothetical protein